MNNKYKYELNDTILEDCVISLETYRLECIVEDILNGTTTWRHLYPMFTQRRVNNQLYLTGSYCEARLNLDRPSDFDIYKLKQNDYE